MMAVQRGAGWLASSFARTEALEERRVSVAEKMEGIFADEEDKARAKALKEAEARWAKALANFIDAEANARAKVLKEAAAACSKALADEVAAKAKARKLLAQAREKCLEEVLAVEAGQKMVTALEEAEAAKALEEAEGAMAKAGKILGEVYGLTYMEAEAAVADTQAAAAAKAFEDLNTEAAALKVEAQARVKVLEQVVAPPEAKAIVLADMRTVAAAAAKFLDDAEANAGAKALEEGKAAFALVHSDVELARVAKAFQDEDDALSRVVLRAARELPQKFHKEVSETIPRKCPKRSQSRKRALKKAAKATYIQIARTDKS